MFLNRAYNKLSGDPSVITHADGESKELPSASCFIIGQGSSDKSCTIGNTHSFATILLTGRSSCRNQLPDLYSHRQSNSWFGGPLLTHIVSTSMFYNKQITQWQNCLVNGQQGRMPEAIQMKVETVMKGFHHHTYSVLFVSNDRFGMIVKFIPFSLVAGLWFCLVGWKYICLVGFNGCNGKFWVFGCKWCDLIN